MSQTLCNRRDFLPSMRRLYASGDLAQPNSIRQCADRASPRSETNEKLPIALARPRLRPHLQAASCWRPGQIEISAIIKST